MTIIYHEEQGDLELLRNRPIGVIGYGQLGRPTVLNLRDSGLPVRVGIRSPEARESALADGSMAVTVEEAAQQCDILLLMLPNEAMPPFYLEQISPHLRRGQTLIFGSAYNVTYRFIEPPAFVDVGLVAPRAPGSTVREAFEQGEGFQSFVAVGQDASGQAWNTVLAVARGMGALRGGAVEVSFEQEAELDLFTQQTILPALQKLLLTAADLLLGRGYPAEAVFTELYLSRELETHLNKFAQQGMLKTLTTLPLAQQYGIISRLDRYDELKLERIMEMALKDIHEGQFVREWAREYETGARRLRTYQKNQEKLEIWELEQQTLDMLGRGDETFI